MTKNWKKFTAEKKLNFFGSKPTIYLSLGLHKGRPSYKRSIQLSKENNQHFKTWSIFIFFYFCGSFLPSWIRIQIHWPGIRIRIRNPVCNPPALHVQFQIKNLALWLGLGTKLEWIRTKNLFWCTSPCLRGGSRWPWWCPWAWCRWRLSPRPAPSTCRQFETQPAGCLSRKKEIRFNISLF